MFSFNPKPGGLKWRTGTKKGRAGTGTRNSFPTRIQYLPKPCYNYINNKGWDPDPAVTNANIP
jgi:hypothetical protein